MDPLLVLPNMLTDLARVEERLKLETVSELEFLTQISNHLIPAGGKRIRPGFAIVAAGFQSKDSVSDDVIRGAAAVELVHLGSLYHDDVMDGAEKRRNVDSVNIKFGDHNAILAGDFLLARASLLAAELGTEVSRLLASTIEKLCAGQIAEHKDIFNTQRTFESYMKSIEGKTASLLSAACSIGALTSYRTGAEPVIEKLGEFGHSYGMAFQIVDDISDLLADSSDLGKPGGNDIAEGNYTLPVIYAMNKNLKALLEKADTKAAIDLVVKSPGLKKAREDAYSYAQKAENAIQGLPQGPATKALESALAHLLMRLADLKFA